MCFLTDTVVVICFSLSLCVYVCYFGSLVNSMSDVGHASLNRLLPFPTFVIILVLLKYKLSVCFN